MEDASRNIPFFSIIISECQKQKNQLERLQYSNVAIGWHEDNECGPQHGLRHLLFQNVNEELDDG